ncbi:MAG: multidrug ABC transporter ATP-binding protein [Devosia sp. 67-54]|uniref:ABC transporter ATP-binding protein n=1 Tax=unclassified Devosia TaxID=196773 RepID=UPI0009620C94|nr:MULTISPECIES: ABC transporter ATP-binding protein [unclassified Devosia]MBN9305588.1 ABC transporter ATP-binding protein [Devosia sp.]OJX19163.1 MAG: multidrug ABC transporter ATP-binding protein [Devosia sp. 67-54]
MFRSLLHYYRPYRRLALIDFGAAILVGLLELAFPAAVQAFIDRLLPSGAWGWILLAAGGLLLVYALNTVLLGVVNYLGHVLGISIETDMRRLAFAHLTKLSFRYFDNAKTGELITHVTRDLEDVGEVAHHGPEDLLVAVMTFFGALLLMLLVHWPLALVTFAIVPPVTWLAATYGARLTQNWHALFHKVGDFNVRVEESMGGIRVVKAFANEAHEQRLFERDNQSYRDTKLAAYRNMTASITLNYLSTRLLQIVVMLAGTWFVIEGSLSYGGFIAFLLLIDVFMRPIDKITAVLESYPQAFAGFRRFSALLATAPDIADRPGAVEVGHLKGDIAYTDASFSYGGSRKVLDRLNLRIGAGETVALVGPSGAGKTTICSLLPRFYELESGSIRIDGIDIRDMTQASLRAQIGIVQQDVFLFGGSIRENIAYGRLGAGDGEILEAARRAELDGLIASLPEGLDTLVGERGVKLSGGQKQRLAIARIFLKNPPILILDEATSALDTATERLIQASLTELSKGRTTLVIAHRLATVRNADRILVIDEGGLIEQGTHAELVGRRGLYATLNAFQDGPGAATSDRRSP